MKKAILLTFALLLLASSVSAYTYAYRGSNVAYTYNPRYGTAIYVSAHDIDYCNRYYCTTSEKAQLLAAYNYVSADYNKMRYLNYGKSTAEVYSDEKANSEIVPASNWRNKEVYDTFDYPRPDYAEPIYNRYSSKNNAEKRWNYYYNTYNRGRRETATTPYYYEPQYDSQLGYYNWRY